MHLIGGVVTGVAVAAIAGANPITTLAQFSSNIAESTTSSISRCFFTPSILARGMKPKLTKTRQSELPPPPKRGVPGGST